MRNNQYQWKRVTRAEPCAICEKGDWCLVAADGTAAICARIESPKPAGRAGWVHPLCDDGWQRPAWRSVKRSEPAKHSANMLKVAQRCCREILPASFAWLCNELHLSIESLKRLRVGWNDQRKAYSFPMREPNGYVCGIRYRATSGAKFAETGGREGLFFYPPGLIRDYVAVVEGASDAAAVMDLGFTSVVGRANCTGNVGQLLTLCRRLRPKRVVIVPDNDRPGIDGATALLNEIANAGGAVRLLELPAGVKDVRQSIVETKNAEWLRDQLGKVCGTSSSNKEATKHDNDT